MKIFRTNSKLIAKILACCLYVNLTLSMGLTAKSDKKDSKITTYSRLGDIYLPSLAKQEQIEIEEYQNLKEDNSDLVKKKKISQVNVPEIGEAEKIRLMFSMLSSQARYGEESKEDTVNEDTLVDLEVLRGYAPDFEHHIASCTDFTKTTAGKIELLHKLFKLTNDIPTLQNEQQIVKTIVNNKKLFDLLEQKLSLLQEAENELIWFWKDIEEEVDLFFNQVFFQKSFLRKYNKSTTALEFQSLWSTVLSPTLTASSPLISTAAASVFSTIMERQLRDHNQSSFLEDFWEVSKMFLSLIKRSTFYTIFNLEFDGPLGRTRVGAPILVRLADAGVCGLALFLHLRLVRKDINSAIDKNRVINLIQQKMINIATYVNTIKEIGSILNSHKLLKTIVPSLNNLQKVSSSKKEVQDLENMLNTSTFKGSASFFSNRGKALAAFKMMHNVKNDFINSIRAAGQIDAYLSIAKLYKQSQNHPNARYCFVDYKDASRPHIKINNFWHPFLDPNKVVTNSIELGGHLKEKDIILTGPNAAGKSTALKGISVAILLGQAFGIAPASEMSFTPFAQIRTYLNIADTQGKESLFQAEMRRARELINSIRALGRNQFSFVIMDEIFTGTNPKEGKAGAYGVSKNLSTFNNSMMILATHFKKLTDLDKDTNGTFKNYKVFVIKNPNGSLTYPYELKEGTSDQAIALELLQAEGFDSQILQDAYTVFHEKDSHFETSELPNLG